METLQALGAGLLAAGQPDNLALCLVGVLLGTLIGVLPGIGPSATLAMLLPLTYYLSPLGALIMLAGIYYGAQYGGSTTAILVNMPGEASSVVTAADGHQMARQGRAGAALAVAALASFVAGMLSNVALAWTGPFLAGFALQFGPAEYFALAVFGLLSATTLSSGSAIKAIGMACLGLLLSTVGVDVNSGVDRLTFGSAYLYDGISFVVLAVGFFAIAEIMVNLHDQAGSVSNIGKVSRLWPSRDDFRKGIPAALRGTVVGTVVGSCQVEAPH
jgi:putative tricarboxylic transport membrane protein